jgi:hypothetical protein
MPHFVGIFFGPFLLHSAEFFVDLFSALWQNTAMVTSAFSATLSSRQAKAGELCKAQNL